MLAKKGGPRVILVHSSNSPILTVILPTKFNNHYFILLKKLNFIKKYDFLGVHNTQSLTEEIIPPCPIDLSN